MTDTKRTLAIELDAEQRRQLRMLRSSPAMGEDATLEQVIAYILSSVCDGVRRSGSWEAHAVTMMFGDWHWEPPPLCSACEFEVLDEDDALEIESKRCEGCLIELIDAWEQTLPEDEDDEAGRFELCSRAYAGESDALRACWDQLKAAGLCGDTRGLAPEATPVRCNGDAEPRRAVSDESPGTRDPAGR